MKVRPKENNFELQLQYNLPLSSLLESSRIGELRLADNSKALLEEFLSLPGLNLERKREEKPEMKEEVKANGGLPSSHEVIEPTFYESDIGSKPSPRREREDSNEKNKPSVSNNESNSS